MLYKVLDLLLLKPSQSEDKPPQVHTFESCITTDSVREGVGAIANRCEVCRRIRFSLDRTPADSDKVTENE